MTSATTTDDVVAGLYTWVAQVAYGGEKFTVDSGVLTVNPDYHTGTSTATYDGRSHARIVLAAIEAVIEGRASIDQEGYEIAGRSLKRVVRVFQATRTVRARDPATSRAALRRASPYSRPSSTTCCAAAMAMARERATDMARV